MRRIVLALLCLTTLSGCAGVLDFCDHSALDAPPGWAPHGR